MLGMLPLSWAPLRPATPLAAGLGVPDMRPGAQEGKAGSRAGQSKGSPWGPPVGSREVHLRGCRALVGKEPEPVGRCP